MDFMKKILKGSVHLFENTLQGVFTYSKILYRECSIIWKYFTGSVHLFENTWTGVFTYLKILYRECSLIWKYFNGSVHIFENTWTGVFTYLKILERECSHIWKYLNRSENSDIISSSGIRNTTKQIFPLKNFWFLWKYLFAFCFSSYFGGF